tara:strand:+ start:813 stop:974 length:162 start_codon:yes stop_codon:yes gene_type:complete
MFNPKFSFKVIRESRFKIVVYRRQGESLLVVDTVKTMAGVSAVIEKSLAVKNG